MIRAIGEQSPLWLPEGVGVAQTGGLVRQRWYVNNKRVHRLWREAGLRVLAKQRKRRRISSEGENSCTLRRSEYKDHVWSYDFVMDQTEDGRRLKMMPVVDEYTRESLSIEVKRSITAKEVVKILSRLFAQRGEPAFIRSGLRSRVHCQSCKAVAGGFGRPDPLHRAG